MAHNLLTLMQGKIVVDITLKKNLELGKIVVDITLKKIRTW